MFERRLPARRLSNPRLMKNLCSVILLILFITIILSGCSFYPNILTATPWPTNYLSTAIFQTMEAIPGTSQASPIDDVQVTSTSLILEATPILETKIYDDQPGFSPSPNIQST